LRISEQLTSFSELHLHKQWVKQAVQLHEAESHLHKQ